LGISDPREPFYDALRLGEAERRELLSVLDSRRSTPRGADLREEERLDYTLKGLIVQMRHPGGSCINYLVRPRNISVGGIGFLHGSFCYTGTPCELSLRTVDGKRELVGGRVVRCQHLQGLVHEVGVKFNEPIDLDKHVGSFVRSEHGLSPATRLPRFQGRVLYVEDCVDDQQLLGFYLEATGATLALAPDGEQAIELLGRESFDLVITGLWLPGMSGLDLMAQVRQTSPDTPVVVLTADHTDGSLSQAREAGAAAVMTKPYCLEQLVEQLGVHLMPAADPDAEPLVSEHWPNIRMRPLILNYLDRLDEQVTELSELVRDREQRETLARLAGQMRGSAGGYGYPQISEAAARLYDAASSEQTTLDELRLRFAELNRLCSAACQLRPARPDDDDDADEASGKDDATDRSDATAQ